jgi:hypothetical protein
MNGFISTQAVLGGGASAGGNSSVGEDAELIQLPRSH